MPGGARARVDSRLLKHAPAGAIVDLNVDSDSMRMVVNVGLMDRRRFEFIR